RSGGGQTSFRQAAIEVAAPTRRLLRLVPQQEPQSSPVRGWNCNLLELIRAEPAMPGRDAVGFVVMNHTHGDVVMGNGVPHRKNFLTVGGGGWKRPKAVPPIVRLL